MIVFMAAKLKRAENKSGVLNVYKRFYTDKLADKGDFDVFEKVGRRRVLGQPLDFSFLFAFVVVIVAAFVNAGTVGGVGQRFDERPRGVETGLVVVVVTADLGIAHGD